VVDVGFVPLNLKSRMKLPDDPGVIPTNPKE
jgi:hypothetical protein